jgi:hypothetical protein
MQAEKSTKSADASAKKKPNIALLAGAAAAVLAVVGVGAFTLRGGGSQSASSASQVGGPSMDESAGTVAALGPAQPTPDANTATSQAANAAEQQTNQPAGEQPNTLEALRSEKAKTAAAEAKLAALKKAAAKAAAAPTIPSAPTPPTRNGKAGNAAQASSNGGQTGGVSSAKLSQFNSIVDDGRSMAKQAMRSGNGQNAQLARNYDQYLKTLKDSMRGIQSDKEADKLIKQASQTRAYIKYLLRPQ